MLFNHGMIVDCCYRVLYTYAPFADQPKLDRTADEIPEVSKACLIYLMCNVCMHALCI